MTTPENHKSFTTNSIELTGNVGSDILLEFTDAGTARLSFSLAAQIRTKANENKALSMADWHYVVMWGVPAELLYDQMSAGDFVQVKGHISYKKYPDADGKIAKHTIIVAHEVRPVGNF